MMMPHPAMRGMKMYKIELYDECCSPIADGTESYFVDDIDDFEEKWIPLVKERNPEKVDRYFKSKGGEIISDYWCDSEELNIYQEDNGARIIDEQDFEEVDFDITLTNVYDWPSNYHIQKLSYNIRKIVFKNKYYLVAKYHIKGIYRYDEYCDRWSDTIYHLVQADYFGNPICILNMAKLYGFDKRRPEEEMSVSNKPDNFLNDAIDCFVWLPIAYCDENTQIHRLSENELAIMLRDIPGEGG